MKMPSKIDEKMLAMCGMNCSVCYKHLSVKKYSKSCHGCRQGDETLPNSCRKCKIKDCANEKNLKNCFLCKDYPCKWIKTLDKSYRQRYDVSLIENGLCCKKDGIDSFLRQEKKKWTCPKCKGIISLHDKFCSECFETISLKN